MKIYRRKKRDSAIGKSFDLLIQNASNRVITPGRTHQNKPFNDLSDEISTVKESKVRNETVLPSVFDVIDDDGSDGKFIAYLRNRKPLKNLKKSFSECKVVDLNSERSESKSKAPLCEVNIEKIPLNGSCKNADISIRNSHNVDYLLLGNDFSSEVPVLGNKSLLVRSCSEGGNTRYTGPRKIFSTNIKKRKAVCQLSSFFDQDKNEETKIGNKNDKVPVVLSSNPGNPVLKKKKYRDETKVLCHKEDKMLFTVISNVRQAYKCEELGEVQGFLDDWDYNISGFKATDDISTKIHCAIQLVKHCVSTEFRNELRSEKVVRQLFELFSSNTESVALLLYFLFILWNLARDESNFSLEDYCARYLMNLLTKTEENNVSTVDMDYDYYSDTMHRLKNLAEELIPIRTYKSYLILDFSVEALILETLSIILKRCSETVLNDDEVDIFPHLRMKLKRLAINFQTMSLKSGVQTGLFKLSRCLQLLSTFIQCQQNKINSFFFDSKDDLLDSLEKIVNGGLNYVQSFNSGSTEIAMIMGILRECYSVLVDITTENELTSQCISENKLFLQSVLLLSEIDRSPFICGKFEILVLILALIVNLVQYSQSIRKRIIVDASNSNRHAPVLPILIEVYKRREDSALKAESQEENQWMSFYEIVSSDKNNDKISKALQKADKHMEDSILASYIAMIVGTLIENNTEHSRIMKCFIDPQNVHVMISLLRKVYTFMEISNDIKPKGKSVMQNIISTLEAFL